MFAGFSRRHRFTLAVLVIPLFLAGCSLGGKGASGTVPKDIEDTVYRFYDALFKGDLDSLKQTVSGTMATDLPRIAGPYVHYALLNPEGAKATKAEIKSARMVAAQSDQWAVVDVLVVASTPYQNETAYGAFSHRLHLWNFGDGWRIYYSEEAGAIVP
ncbi:MAG: hypothetical protein KM310_10890 [Clostridiales bacterium]|nr:hypothetical protein [Clostridiales bacterium]